MNLSEFEQSSKKYIVPERDACSAIVNTRMAGVDETDRLLTSEDLANMCMSDVLQTIIESRMPEYKPMNSTLRQDLESMGHEERVELLLSIPQEIRELMAT